MQIFIQVLILPGALAMFLYGMLLMSEGMRKRLETHFGIA